MRVEGLHALPQQLEPREAGVDQGEDLPRDVVEVRGQQVEVVSPGLGEGGGNEGLVVVDLVLDQVVVAPDGLVLHDLGTFLRAAARGEHKEHRWNEESG